MANILIQSAQSRDLHGLERLFNKHLYETQFSYNKRSTEALIRYEKPSLFVWDMHSLNRKVIPFLKNLRNTGFQAPILILANEIDSNIVKELKHIDRAHHVKLPTVPNKLIKLTHKLVTNPNIKHQAFTRFDTNQTLDVENILTGENFDSLMKNLSMGGAYCEFDGPVQLNKGDLTRLNLSLDNVKNTHKMNAQVVWKEHDSIQQKYCVGFRFLNTQDLYKHLMTQT
ncbi:MAG: PilZ domain-containing protein [Bdellovibrionaceae bacterium]|jgi:hypothetical protein|nr:PilZ domain-containing protein [Pseudobdellovibrionaceae bacterium]